VNVQYLHPINEDTDFEEYEFANGELPPVPSNWTGDTRPPNLYEMPKSFTSNPASDPVPTPELAATSVQVGETIFSDDESSDADTKLARCVIPEEDSVEEEKGPAQLFPTIVSLPTPEPEPLPSQKPAWWTEAWDILDGIRSEHTIPRNLIPMSPEEFSYRCNSDVHAIDQYCTRSIIDPDTGESRLAGEADDENQVVTGVIWSDEAITMSDVHGKGRDPDELFLAHLKKMLDLCPNHGAFYMYSASEFLVTEGSKFREWVESDSLGRIWDQIHGNWKNIWGHLKMQGKHLSVVGRSADEFPQQSEALRKYSEERIQRKEAYARGEIRDDDPGDPPWA
jgi:hypothetical protein